MDPSPHTASAAPAGRFAQRSRALLRVLAESRLVRTAALALVAGLGIALYAQLQDGRESLERGGWAAALTSAALIASYAAGFLIRRALKLVLALAGLAAGAFVILKASGVDVSLSDVTDAASGAAERLEGVVRSWLPAGAGSATGLWFGLRRGKRGD